MKEDVADDPAEPVLVVEDHDDREDVVESILRHAGYKVATAVHGRDALDQLEAGLRPCLILLDLSMPVMDGVTFARALHGVEDSNVAATPIVLLTAQFDVAVVMKTIGALDIIRKPVAFDRLLETVNRLCRR